MKYVYIALCIAVLGIRAQSGLDSATFDRVVDLYKNKELSRKELIAAYDQLDDKRLGDQLLRAMLRTNIGSLRSEENRTATSTLAVPAPTNRGRKECAGKGCSAKTRKRTPQSPNKRQKRPNRNQRPQVVRSASPQATTNTTARPQGQSARRTGPLDQRSNFERDIDRATLLSLQDTHIQQQEDLELAQAIAASLDEQPAHGTSTPAPDNSAQRQEQEDRELAQAIAASQEQQGPTHENELEQARVLSLLEAQEQEAHALNQALTASCTETPTSVQPSSRPVGMPARRQTTAQPSVTTGQPVQQIAEHQAPVPVPRYEDIVPQAVTPAAPPAAIATQQQPAQPKATAPGVQTSLDILNEVATEQARQETAPQVVSTTESHSTSPPAVQSQSVVINPPAATPARTQPAPILQTPQATPTNRPVQATVQVPAVETTQPKPANSATAVRIPSVRETIQKPSDAAPQRAAASVTGTADPQSSQAPEPTTVGSVQQESTPEIQPTPTDSTTFDILDEVAQEVAQQGAQLPTQLPAQEPTRPRAVSLNDILSRPAVDSQGSAPDSALAPGASPDENFDTASIHTTRTSSSFHTAQGDDSDDDLSLVSGDDLFLSAQS